MPEIANTPGNNSSKFDRQRRNLTITWVVLFFLQTVNPDIERINLSPFQVSVVTNKELLILWMCGLLIYFLIRYMQYFNTVINAALDYYLLKDTYAKQFIRRRLEPLAREQLGNEWQDGLIDMEPSPIYIRGAATNSYEITHINVHKGGAVVSQNIKPIVLPLTKFEEWWSTQKAFMVTAWNSHSFSEYYLPFALPYVSVIWEIGKRIMA